MHLVLGMQGTSQVDQTRFASHLLNAVLGSSMSSRLFQEIREKHGLAYSVYSFSIAMKIPGCSAYMRAFLRRMCEKVLFLINEQLSMLSQKPISETELHSAKEYIKGNMYINAESND